MTFSIHTLASLSSLLLAVAVHADLETSLTVYHVGGRNDEKTLADRNTGDALGDLNFFLPQFFLPMACKNPISHIDPRTKFDCQNPERTDPDLMITKMELLVDSNYTGYAECNFCNGHDPLTHLPCKKGSYVCDCPFCDRAKVGRKTANGLYVCIPHLTPYWDCWGANIDKQANGLWYSTPHQGMDKSWKVASTTSIQSKCVKDAVATAVERAGPRCFSTCGGQRDYESKRWIECFFSTLLGPESSKKVVPDGVGMDMKVIAKVWQDVFLPESEGGCPRDQGTVIV